MLFEKNGTALSALSIGLLTLLVVGVGLSLGQEYMGLEPGISKKSDADRALGTPKEEVVRGVVYDYSPPADDIRRVSIKFAERNQIIEKIDIYPQGAYTKGRHREWFLGFLPGARSVC